MPRRAVGEIVVINTTPTTATGMLVFSLEDIHVGDAWNSISNNFRLRKIFREASASLIFFVDEVI